MDVFVEKFHKHVYKCSSYIQHFVDYLNDRISLNKFISILNRIYFTNKYIDMALNLSVNFTDAVVHKIKQQKIRPTLIRDLYSICLVSSMGDGLIHKWQIKKARAKFASATTAREFKHLILTSPGLYLLTHDPAIQSLTHLSPYDALRDCSYYMGILCWHQPSVIVRTTIIGRMCEWKHKLQKTQQVNKIEIQQ